MEWIVFVSETETQWGVRYKASHVPFQKAAGVVWSILRKNTGSRLRLSGKKEKDGYNLSLTYWVGDKPRVKKGEVRFSAASLPQKSQDKEPQQVGTKYLLNDKRHILWAARRVEEGEWESFTFIRNGTETLLEVGWEL